MYIISWLLIDEEATMGNLKFSKKSCPRHVTDLPLVGWVGYWYPDPDHLCQDVKKVCKLLNHPHFVIPAALM
jgi:hypothetical protein